MELERSRHLPGGRVIMARIRTIKPQFFRSQDVADLTIQARLTWIGLLTYVDDSGRGKDDPRLIKGDVWPLDDHVTTAHVEAIMVELAEHGRIHRYEVDGIRYLEVVNFLKHQRINRATPSVIPPSALTEHSLSTHGGLTEDSLQEGKGREGNKEGKGSDTAPPRKCPKHLHDSTHAPCLACRDARLAREDWDKAQKAIPTPHAPRAEAVRSQFCAIAGHDDYPLPCDKCQREQEDAA